MKKIMDKDIYAIQHNCTKRVYVGCSIHYEKRIRQHLSHLRNHNHENKEFQKDYDLFGEDYSFYILQRGVSHYRSFDVEKMWIRMLRTNEIERGYNLSRMERPLKIDDFDKVYVQLGNKKSKNTRSNLSSRRRFLV